MPETKNQVSKELQEIALQIFSARAAQVGLPPGLETQAALVAYRAAKGFLAAREKIISGELDVEPPTGLRLADCCVPNLRPTNPINLVSQKFGDLQKVQLVFAWISKNPLNRDEANADEVLARFNKAFPGFDWELPELHTAQIVFPHYIPAA